jgi:phosphatidylinositol-3-phosphatase
VVRRRKGKIGLVLAAFLAVTGCTAGSSPIPDGTPVPVVPGEIPTPDHVLVVVFENKDAEDVVGSPEAPYLNSLFRSGANFTDAHAVTHPSQPNYVALFSGSTKDITDDSCPQELQGENLAEQLITAGRTFAGYSEDLPRAGATDCKADGYRRKHNPWVDFGGLPRETNQPYSALPDDYADLPTVSFVVPNLCHDMHDCDVATGDRWARDHLAPYVAWARTNNSLLVVTFDEASDSSGDNRIGTALVGPMVRAGDTSQLIDHYSILRMIEEMYGLPPLGLAANRAAITGVWLSPAK